MSDKPWTYDCEGDDFGIIAIDTTGTQSYNTLKTMNGSYATKREALFVGLQSLLQTKAAVMHGIHKTRRRIRTIDQTASQRKRRHAAD